MKPKNEVLKKKAATYSISKMTEERIDSIGTEVLRGGVVADHLEEIFQTINEQVFKKWQNEKLEKIVSLIGALKFSSKGNVDWKKVVEDGLGGDSKFFYDLVETLGLECDDVKIFAWECSNIALKKKKQAHKEYEKKHKTFTLYENTEDLLSQIQNILGENKSNTFQFVVLLYFYLKLPYAKYHKAKQLLATYNKAFAKISRLEKLVKRTAEELKEMIEPDDNNGVPIERSLAMQINLEPMEEELSFYWYMFLFRIESLDLILSQIDESD